MGRGNRQRKQINYADDLTEMEFMRAVELGDIDEMKERKRAKVEAKRPAAAAAADSPAADGGVKGECGM